MPFLEFGPDVEASRVSAESRAVLKRVLAVSGNDHCLVTSAQRTPDEQARVMYDLILAHGGMDGGVTYARGLYLAPGQKVIDTYVFWHESGRFECIAAMATTIRQVGPSKVSRHCADSSVLQVLDIAPSSLAKPVAFRLAAEKEPAISKVLGPPSDPAVHIEIPQTARPA